MTQAFHFSPARFRVLSMGRQTGKTTAMIQEMRRLLWEGYIATQKKVRGWIVAPTFTHVKEAFRVAQEQLRPLIQRQTESTELTQDLPFGTLEYKSADRGDISLRGATLWCAAFDETALVDEKAWLYGVRPALAQHQGRAIFCSTPRSRNWFYDLYRQGQATLDGQPNPTYDDQWASWSCPSSARPSFPPEEWRRLQATMPELLFRQEYLAEFVHDQGMVFNITAALRGTLADPRPQDAYTAGIDVAKAEDFLAVTVMHNATRQLIALDRFKYQTWALQKQAVLAKLAPYRRCQVLIDSTGVGDPIAEDLRRAGLSIEDIKFTAKSKQELVEQLIVAIDQGLIGLPDTLDTQWLLNELRDYTYTRLPSGGLRYSAPAGRHDDGVVALMLAVWGLRFHLHEPILPPPPPDDGTLGLFDFWEQRDKEQAWQRAYPRHPAPSIRSLTWETMPRWRRYYQPVPYDG